MNTSDECGQTPLMCAASGGSRECVNALLAAGADVNGTDGFQNELNGNGSFLSSTSKYYAYLLLRYQNGRAMRFPTCFLKQRWEELNRTQNLIYNFYFI